MKDEYCGYDTEDIHSEQELDEVMCEVCGTIQPATNKFCTHCGEDFKKGIIKDKNKVNGKNSKNLLVFIILVIIIVVIMVGFSVLHNILDENERRNKEKISIEIPEISMPEISIPDIEIPDIEIPEIEVSDIEVPEIDFSENSVEDDENVGVYPRGEYVVGEDIPAGEYLLYSDDLGNNVPEGFDEAYASLLDDEEEIFGSWFESSRYVKLEDGQYLDLAWCSAYDTSMHTIENNPFEHSGMFKVGVDVEAGTYKVKTIDDSDMYFYYVHDSLEDFDDDAMYEFFRENYTEEKIVTLENGQYLELFHCILEK